MKQAKSLCESCSNRVVIKYHNEESKYHNDYCFFEFVKTRWSSNNRLKELESIVDECTFYNKSIINLNKRKANKKSEDTDEDYGTDSKGNRMYGATFVNIPGALLP